MSAEPLVVRCLKCNRDYRFPDITGFLEVVRKDWEQFFSSVSQEMKDEAKPYLGELAIRNTVESGRAAMKEKGFLRMLCKPCMAELSAEVYSNNGYNVIAVGSFVFEKNFLLEHSGMCQELISKDAWGLARI